MPLFDAVNHAFSIAATGGFSTKNLSIAAFDSRLIDFVAMVFMAVAAIHFGLLYAVVATRSFKPLNNTVVKYYFASILSMTVLISFSLLKDGGYDSWGRALMDSSFNVVSYMSTTGFANCDNSQWPLLASVVLVFVSFHCGCSGSTTGGIKIDRLIISFKAVKNEVHRRIHPSSVSQVRLGGQVLPEMTISAVINALEPELELDFFFSSASFWFSLFSFSSVLISALVTSAVSVASAVASADSFAPSAADDAASQVICSACSFCVFPRFFSAFASASASSSIAISAERIRHL
jgi:Trk-type K+ transport system membrane component